MAPELNAYNPWKIRLGMLELGLKSQNWGGSGTWILDIASYPPCLVCMSQASEKHSVNTQGGQWLRYIIRRLPLPRKFNCRHMPICLHTNHLHTYKYMHTHIHTKKPHKYKHIESRKTYMKYSTLT